MTQATKDTTATTSKEDTNDKPSEASEPSHVSTRTNQIGIAILGSLEEVSSLDGDAQRNNQTEAQKLCINHSSTVIILIESHRRGGLDHATSGLDHLTLGSDSMRCDQGYIIRVV
jgi:hypothetical protein